MADDPKHTTPPDAPNEPLVYDSQQPAPTEPVYDNAEPEIERGLSPVAFKKGRNITVIVVAIFAMGAFIYSNFFDTENQTSINETPEDHSLAPGTTVTRPTEGGETDLPTLEGLPEPPPLIAPTPPPAAPMLPVPSAEAPPAALPEVGNKEGSKGDFFPSLGGFGSKSAEPIDFASMPKDSGISAMTGNSERMRSGLIKGGGNKGGDGEKKDPNEQGSRFFKKAAESGAKAVLATTILDTSRTIAQGKMIEAVLETAINTDLEGSVRAIVSRDVYAESGKGILIPKGSRLLGSYASDVQRGQRRVALQWVRLIRPDGIDFNLDSGIGYGSDMVGRAGVGGVVDNHYFEIIYNAILLSTLRVAWTKAAQNITKVGDNLSTTTTGPDGTVTQQTTSNNTKQAIDKANDDVGKAVEDITKQQVQVKPTIEIDQGTRIRVFVTRDLIFPSNMTTGARVLQ